MKRLLASAIRCLAWGAFLFTSITIAPAQQPPPPQPAFAPEPTIRMRGPIHEAFASPFAPDPEPGFLVPLAPPPPIQEVPPAIRPVEDGFEYIWIPGYWGWEEGVGFIWISGMWRKAPPDMVWVSGYWLETERGCQWVGGFWINERAGQVAYLPAPPPSREQGPTIAPPDDFHFWVPGHWLFHGDRYAWREGFWSRARADWVWVPAQYQWTPRGYVYVAGYWDFPPEERGLLFAPAEIPAGWRGVYAPSVVLEVPSVMVHMFVRPRYCHYYFGDYYAIGARAGFSPWMTYAAAGARYDPLWIHLRFSNAPRFRTLHHHHIHFVKHPHHRPPATWIEYRQFIGRQDNAIALSIQLGQPLANLPGQRKGQRFVQVTQEQQLRIEKARHHHQQFTLQRMKEERSARPGQGPAQWTLPASKGKESTSRPNLPASKGKDRPLPNFQPPTERIIPGRQPLPQKSFPSPQLPKGKSAPGQIQQAPFRQPQVAPGGPGGGRDKGSFSPGQGKGKGKGR